MRMTLRQRRGWAVHYQNRRRERQAASGGGEETPAVLPEGNNYQFQAGGFYLRDAGGSNYLITVFGGEGVETWALGDAVADAPVATVLAQDDNYAWNSSNEFVLINLDYGINEHSLVLIGTGDSVTWTFTAGESVSAGTITNAGNYFRFSNNQFQIWNVDTASWYVPRVVSEGGLTLQFLPAA